jgi:hypothetical protein
MSSRVLPNLVYYSLEYNLETNSQPSTEMIGCAVSYLIVLSTEYRRYRVICDVEIIIDVESKESERKRPQPILTYYRGICEKNEKITSHIRG